MLNINRSSAIFQPHQPPAAVNSCITNHEGMDEADNQQQLSMPHYDQPERIIVSHALHDDSRLRQALIQK